MEVERKLKIEAEAAKNLLAALADQIDEEDDEMIVDTVEGETSLLETIEKAIDDIALTEAMVIGIKAKEEEMARRRQRLSSRIERVKASIEQAMAMIQQDKLMLPTATLSVRPAPMKVVITDEQAIPSRFWKVPAPVLDRKLLRDELKSGVAILGAMAEDGGRSLSIRRK